MKFIYCLVIIAFSSISLDINVVVAQNTVSIQHVLQAQSPSPAYQPMVKKVTFLKSKSNHKLAKFNPVQLVFVGMMYTYQRFLSAQFAAECPYELSCSNFSKTAIARYGLLKGIALSADRLMRCNEFLKYDLTPVNLTKDNHLIDPIEDYHF